MGEGNDFRTRVYENSLLIVMTLIFFRPGSANLNNSRVFNAEQATHDAPRPLGPLPPRSRFLGEDPPELAVRVPRRRHDGGFHDLPSPARISRIQARRCATRRDGNVRLGARRQRTSAHTPPPRLATSSATRRLKSCGHYAGAAGAVRKRSLLGYLRLRVSRRSAIPDDYVRELAKRVCRARRTGINGSWMNRAKLLADQAFRCLCLSRQARSIPERKPGRIRSRRRFNRHRICRFRRIPRRLNCRDTGRACALRARDY